MQVVPDEVRKCVVFIYYKDTNDNEILFGTAFFVSVPIDVPGFQMSYLVTAKHVIKGIELKSRAGLTDGRVYIKANDSNGTVTRVVSDLSEWKYHPTDSSVDAAVLNWTPPEGALDMKNVPVSMAVTYKLIKYEEIGAGDEVFLTGLFHSHSGTKKNLPIIRTGNIALMPEEKVNTSSFGDIDAYLVEARSIGGLSGSPVFVYLGHTRVKGGNINLGGGSPLFAWLGVMHGHWDIDENNVDSEGDATSVVGKSVNMGIGIVVPATKVIDILETEELIKERKAASEYRKKIK